MHNYCVCMSTKPPPRTVHLGSAGLRALAHPLRIRLLGALRLYGPATATGLAERLDTNSGATSYHLRKLADVGLVEEDPERGAGRERWWRAAHEFTSWVETEFVDDPDDRAAADWLFGQYTRAKARWVEDWLAARSDWPKAWRDAADSSDVELHLTAGQLAALGEELREVIGRYRAAEAGPDDDVQRVIVLLEAFPSPAPRI